MYLYRSSAGFIWTFSYIQLFQSLLSRVHLNPYHIQIPESLLPQLYLNCYQIRVPESRLSRVHLNSCFIQIPKSLLSRFNLNFYHMQIPERLSLENIWTPIIYRYLNHFFPGYIWQIPESLHIYHLSYTDSWIGFSLGYIWTSIIASLAGLIRIFPTYISICHRYSKIISVFTWISPICLNTYKT